MSAATFEFPRSSTPIVEIPPIEIDLTQDWGDAGPPPPRAPRLQRQNAMTASYHVDLAHDDDVSRELFPVSIAEHVTGVHFDHPLMNRVHFDPTFWDKLYETRYDLLPGADTVDKIIKSFNTILTFMNYFTTPADFPTHGVAVYVVPLLLPAGNTWQFKTFEGAQYKVAGGIPLADLGIPENLAIEYMACDYLRHQFVNDRYLRPDLATLSPPAALAEINAILARQCELHLELCGFIVK